MRDKQPRSTTYGKAQVSGDVPRQTPEHGPYGHTQKDQGDKNPNMPCKNSLPT